MSVPESVALTISEIDGLPFLLIVAMKSCPAPGLGNSAPVPPTTASVVDELVIGDASVVTGLFAKR